MGHKAAECTSTDPPKNLSWEDVGGFPGNMRGSASQEPTQRRFNGYCLYCKGWGHKAMNCPKKMADEAARNGNNRGATQDVANMAAMIQDLRTEMREMRSGYRCKEEEEMEDFVLCAVDDEGEGEKEKVIAE